MRLKRKKISFRSWLLWWKFFTQNICTINKSVSCISINVLKLEKRKANHEKVKKKEKFLSMRKISHQIKWKQKLFEENRGELYIKIHLLFQLLRSSLTFESSGKEVSLTENQKERTNGSGKFCEFATTFPATIAIFLSTFNETSRTDSD